MTGGGETEVIEEGARRGFGISDKELSGFEPNFRVRAGDDF